MSEHTQFCQITITINFTLKKCYHNFPPPPSLPITFLQEPDQLIVIIDCCHRLSSSVMSFVSWCLAAKNTCTLYVECLKHRYGRVIHLEDFA